MKKVISIFLLAIGLVMTASAAPKKDKKAGGEYVGEYDENLTPENSCVIFVCYNYCNNVEFTQINPKCGADKQFFEFVLEGSDFHCVDIKMTDSFDKAKKDLEAKFGKEINLCRVETTIMELGNKDKAKEKNK